MTKLKKQTKNQINLKKLTQEHTKFGVPTRINLPLDGLSRWSQIAPFSPFCREKFRQLVRAGKAPQPVRFSERCTAYSNKQLHIFFADPLNYVAELEAE